MAESWVMVLLTTLARSSGGENGIGSLATKAVGFIPDRLVLCACVVGPFGRRSIMLNGYTRPYGEHKPRRDPASR